MPRLPALVPQSGGGFDLSRNVIAGGGGSSTGSGNLQVDGTAGQAAAGTTMSNGGFSLTGGFWAEGTAIVPHSISGHLTYTNGTTPAKNVTMTLTGPLGFTPVVTTTDSSGNYSFSNVPGGSNYTVTPSKTGDVNGSVTAFDASLAARFAANLISLTANQQIAADASNNGSVSAFDASLIARTAANIANAGIAGTWKFSPASLTVNNLNANQTNQNLTAILVGDVSGNWVPSGPTTMQANSVAAVITVALPNKQDPAGGPSTIPIVAGDTTGQGVGAYDLDVSFDPNVLQPQGTPFDTTGALSSGWSITANTSTPGHLVINGFSTTDMTGQGTLLYLKFNVVGTPNSQTPLAWTSFNFNEGTPGDTDINGQFTVIGPTAAPARISGQIVNADGQPVSGATITVTGGPKLIRAITNSNGFYKVENLETGGFYTVTPSRANYIFAPVNRSFSLIADRTDAVFTGMAIGPDANPLESPEFFVRQQYLDFLGREPDQRGLDYWSGQLRTCGSNPDCLNTRRMEVSAAFFIAQEFQDSGLFIYDLYQGALGRRPAYAEYSVDRRKVVGGPTLEAKKAAFATSFVECSEFIEQYPLTMTADVFVDALLRRAQQTSGLDLSGESSNLINLYNSASNSSESRSLVVRSVVEGSRFKQTQYNSAFVLMEYFGYLGRNPDQDGYDFWLNILNHRDTNNYRGMVCSFITSAEYQRRFSPVLTHSNSECGR